MGFDLILLDTHAVFWAILGPKFLSRRAKSEISRRGTELAISAISIYEIAHKANTGRWAAAVRLTEAGPTKIIEDEGITILPVTGPLLERAAGLNFTHPDPFDRIIAATALEYGAQLLSKDAAMRGFGCDPIW